MPAKAPQIAQEALEVVQGVSSAAPAPAALTRDCGSYWIAKLTSRKFLLAVAAMVTAIGGGQPWGAVVAAGLYALAEGYVDANKETA